MCSRAARFARKGGTLEPVRVAGRAIAGTFWGKAWCDNMERYSDFANRLPRGRTYVRDGSVIDLRIAAGKVEAQVVGSDIYKTTVKISALPKARWKALGRDCACSIDSLVELLQGRLSRGVMARICRPETGLFPSPKEIAFACSCPDWAAMCKHVAAVLYGVGARLDQKPERRLEASPGRQNSRGLRRERRNQGCSGGAASSKPRARPRCSRRPCYQVLQMLPCAP
jgi:uncharacterized Zn finger protein